MRFIDGAPLLDALNNGVPQPLGLDAYLQANAQTVASQFVYGSMTPFERMNAGTLALTARDTLGFSVGPLKSAPLGAGKQYTLIVVGSYPNYQVLTFEEPGAGKGAQLSLYEASPSTAQAGFGSFAASSSSQFKQLGSAKFGTLSTVTLGTSVSNLGGFVGTPGHLIGVETPQGINPFDKRNALPFHAIERLSLFLFDADTQGGSGPPGPVFGSLDK
ncbi:MAG TPA: hypothetical protein VFE16_03865 [Candidatus Cybelea sp.]|nr:hypothetical protein [Candidatus Cybelea sp.]